MQKKSRSDSAAVSSNPQNTNEIEQKFLSEKTEAYFWLQM